MASTERKCANEKCQNAKVYVQAFKRIATNVEIQQTKKQMQNRTATIYFIIMWCWPKGRCLHFSLRNVCNITRTDI